MEAKVLQINTLDNTGGAAKVAYTLHKRYLELGISSHILCGKKTSNDNFVDTIDGFINTPVLSRYIDRYHLRDIIPIKNRNLLNHPYYVNSNIIHLHNLHHGFFELKKLQDFHKDGKKLLWTLHDMWAFTGNSYHTFGCERWREDKGFKCTCNQKHSSLELAVEKLMILNKKNIYKELPITVVSPSRWLAEMIPASILKDKRVEVIPNGIDNADFPSKDRVGLRQELNLPIDQKIICFNAHGGSRNIWKGGKYLEEIIQNLQKTTKIILLELGNTKINQITRNGNIISIPYTNDMKLIYRYMKACDLFISTSIAENFPLVLLEALGLGLPICAFDVGGIKEIVVDGKTGFVSEYLNTQDMIKNILNILNNRKLNIELSSNAISDFSNKYTLDIMAGKYLNLYEEILK